jgi:hypothetical protein
LSPPAQRRPEVEDAGPALSRAATRRATRRAAAAAAAVTLLTRLPFTASHMWDHDSIQFALGVERYNLAAHHPHPPGYPLYIALLKLLAWAGVNALHGMVALSVLASAAGAGLIVLLTARLVEEAEGAPGSGPLAGGSGALRAGLFAAALYAFNPVLWFYGELPLIYAVEGGLSVAVAYGAVRLGDSRGTFLIGCALFALAGGLRQSTMILLAPLFFWGVYRAVRSGRIGWRLLTGGAALGGAIVLAWFVPLCRAAGGCAAYQRISGQHFRALLPYTSILYGAGVGALAHNLEILAKWTLQGVFPGVLALAFLWLTSPRDFLPGLRRLAAVLPWILAWAVPPALFFALFHITKAGYTLVHLPAFLVALAVAAFAALAPRAVAASAGRARRSVAGLPQDDDPAGAGRRRAVGAGALPDAAREPADAERLPADTARRQAGAVRRSPDTSRRLRSAAAIALAAGAGATLFLFGAERRPDQSRLWAVVRHELNRGALAAYERDLDRLLAVLRRYPPETTVLGTVELSGTGAASAEGFLYPWQRHLQWYLPRYTVLWLVPEESLAFTTQGHRPFTPEHVLVPVPSATRRLLLVLSAPTGRRLALPPGRPIGKTFYLVELPFTGRLELGSLLIVAAQPRQEAA